MQERFIENGIEYIKQGDYYFPNLSVLNDKEYNIGKYGRLHSKFIKKHRPAFYTMKMIDGTWLDYLEEIDKTAIEMVDRLVKELATNQGITEELKSKDQFAWVSAMEQVKHTAEEFVFEDIVFNN